MSVGLSGIYGRTSSEEGIDTVAPESSAVSQILKAMGRIGSWGSAEQGNENVLDEYKHLLVVSYDSYAFGILFWEYSSLSQFFLLSRNLCRLKRFWTSIVAHYWTSWISAIVLQILYRTQPVMNWKERIVRKKIVRECILQTSATWCISLELWSTILASKSEVRAAMRRDSVVPNSLSTWSEGARGSRYLRGKK